jgi:hypothetical protein
VVKAEHSRFQKKINDSRRNDSRRRALSESKWLKSGDGTMRIKKIVCGV